MESKYIHVRIVPGNLIAVIKFCITSSLVHLHMRLLWESFSLSLLCVLSYDHHRMLQKHGLPLYEDIIVFKL